MPNAPTTEIMGDRDVREVMAVLHRYHSTFRSSSPTASSLLMSLS
jgi:hypothetical protein